MARVGGIPALVLYKIEIYFLIIKNNTQQDGADLYDKKGMNKNYFFIKINFTKKMVYIS